MSTWLLSTTRRFSRKNEPAQFVIWDNSTKRKLSLAISGFVTSYLGVTQTQSVCASGRQGSDPRLCVGGKAPSPPVHKENEVIHPLIALTPHSLHTTGQTPVNSTLGRSVSTPRPLLSIPRHSSDSQLSQTLNASFHQEAPLFPSLSTPTHPPQCLILLEKTSLVMPWWCVQTTAGSPVLMREIQTPQLWVWILHHLASPTSVPSPDLSPPSSPVIPGAAQLRNLHTEPSWHLPCPFLTVWCLLTPLKHFTASSGGARTLLSVTSTYLCNKVQEIHPRFVCFCVCQFEQRRQFKSYRIASIPSLKKTNQKKKNIYTLLDRQLKLKMQH